jgi:1,2-diacylglycerol 3-alpha-glucosyltransferase
VQVGQFTDSFPPIVNGVSAFVSEHHRELLAQGHVAHIFTFGVATESDSGVHRTRGVPLFNSPFRANLRVDGAAERVAQSLQVFHMHEATMAAGWAALNLAWRYRKPLVFTNHTRHDLYINNYPRIMRPFLHTYIQRVIAYAIRNSDLVTAPSHDTAHWLRALAPECGEHIQVVRNGIRLDEPHTEDATEREAMRCALGISPEATVFIYIGRLSPEKNLMAFAEAFRSTIQQNPKTDAHWLVVGDGMCRPDLEARTAAIRPRVHFVGQVPRPRVRQYLAAADVFATPSLSEVNPVSVIEALACAKPYVGLQAAWWDEFAGERAGVLCNDVADLREAILGLSRNRDLRRELGQRAQDLSQQFDIRVITARWVELYGRVLEGWPYASMMSAPQRLRRLLQTRTT